MQQYGTHSSGALVDSGDLASLCVDLEGFEAEYDPGLEATSLTASSFTADIRYGAPGEEGRATTIGVDDPLRLPSAASLDRVAHRTAVFGFPIRTFAVIAGAIWAERAWGRFRGWDSERTWAFIAWVVCAAYLHARTTAGWRGRPAAWVDVVGLGVMIVNLLYVNMVSTGLHSYGGVS